MTVDPVSLSCWQMVEPLGDGSTNRSIPWA